MLRPSAVLVALSLALPLPACTSARTPDQAAADLAHVNRALAGTWTLAGYQPDVPLEPLLSGLLALQVGQLTVTFDAEGNMDAQSPTVKFHRRYRVTDAEGPRFHLVAIDESNVEQGSTGEFSQDGGTIDFHGDTDPWRGQGKLVRAR